VANKQPTKAKAPGVLPGKLFFFKIQLKIEQHKGEALK